jgi:hypothetical protein
MHCVKDQKQLSAGKASDGSIIGLVLLPKCSLCFAMKIFIDASLLFELPGLS